MPKGSGILIASADETHVYANTLRGNGGAAILVLSWPTVALLAGLAANDDQYDQYSEGSYIHDNIFSGNGSSPAAVFTDLGLMPPHRSHPVGRVRRLDEGCRPASNSVASAS